MTAHLDQLVEMTCKLGQPHLNYVIIGEGNSSCRADGTSFWIKASGHQMDGITEDGFVQVHFEPILAMLDNPPPSRSAQAKIMEAAKVDPAAKGRPSVEVGFHAMLLDECTAQFIGHTHAKTVNQITCSSRAQQFAQNRMFPDEVVLCGPESVFLPYVDPGLPLAIMMRSQVRDFMERYGEAPKVVLMGNHGVIALGQTPTEVLNVMAMCVKAADIFVGACSVGGPVFMSKEDVWNIYKRPDEIYRRNLFITQS